MVRIPKILGFCKKDGRNGDRDMANGCFACDLCSAKWYIALNSFDEMSQSGSSRLQHSADHHLTLSVPVQRSTDSH